MKSSLLERVAGPDYVPAKRPEPSGSSVVLSLRPDPDRATRYVLSIKAIEALVHRGMGVRDAKVAIEVVLDGGGVCVDVPLVKDVGVLIETLRAAGVLARVSSVGAHGGVVDVVDPTGD